MNDALREKLEQLPTTPGVYLMKDRAGKVIYVGKALSLRHRVRSYFNRNSDTRGFIPLLERLLGDIELVLVNTEKEALLLENELIKKHKPRFNVLLRDDKAFITLRLDRTQDFPRLEIHRRMQPDGAKYFGPYASASSIRQTLRLVNRNFHLRTCRDAAFERRRLGKERSSLLCQLNHCPCFTQVGAEDYNRTLDEAVLFLQGRHTELVETLRSRMKEAARALRFEEAARFRDHVAALERSLEKQLTVSSDFLDRDVFALAREGDRILIYVLFVRGGRLSEGRAFPFSEQQFPDEELLSSFVDLYYDGDHAIPDEVLLPFELEDHQAKTEWLTEKRGKRVAVLTPQRGAKSDLVGMAQQNAEQRMRESKQTEEEVSASLQRLQTELGLTRLPQRIECYDISLFQGGGAVGSQVSMWLGQPDKANYRHYRVKTVTGTDDFAMLYEVLTRRLKRGLADQDLPDLMVIDGGKGQLSSAMAAFKDLRITGVDLCSLAKSRLIDEADLALGRGYSGAGRKGRVDAGEGEGRSPERVFLPNVKDPVVLKQNSPELLILARARDEAHRFAITYHRKLRGKQGLKTTLTEVPGVGAVRQRALLRHFGSLKRLRDATEDQIAEVPDLGRSAAQKVYAFLHPAPTDPATPPPSGDGNVA